MEFWFFFLNNFVLKMIVLDEIILYIRSEWLKCEKGYENVYFFFFL